LLAASQHRIGGDERDATTVRLEWGGKKDTRYGWKGRSKRNDREGENIEERGSEGRKQASTKRLFLFSAPLAAV